MSVRLSVSDPVSSGNLAENLAKVLDDERGKTENLTRAGLGRPKGVPNRATVEAKAACAALVDDPEYRRSLAKRLKAGKLSPAVECMLWYYAKGKSKEAVVESAQHITVRWQNEVMDR